VGTFHSLVSHGGSLGFHSSHHLDRKSQGARPRWAPLLSGVCRTPGLFWQPSKQLQPPSKQSNSPSSGEGPQSRFNNWPKLSKPPWQPNTLQMLTNTGCLGSAPEHYRNLVFWPDRRRIFLWSSAAGRLDRVRPAGHQSSGCGRCRTPISFQGQPGTRRIGHGLRP